MIVVAHVGFEGFDIGFEGFEGACFGGLYYAD